MSDHDPAECERLRSKVKNAKETAAAHALGLSRDAYREVGTP